MGKKYEPVPDAKRKQLISLIYEKGLNISKASKEAGIYYPTAKAINKIYLRQNRICKKTNRDRTKKNHNISIKVQEVEGEQELENSPEISQSVTSTKHTNELRVPNYMTPQMHSTACSATENEYSHNKVYETEMAIKREHDIQNDESNQSYYSQPEIQTTICPFHTPDGQAQFSQIMKFMARIKATSCMSCNDRIPNDNQPMHEVQQYEDDEHYYEAQQENRRDKRIVFQRQSTAHFGEEEKVQEIETGECSDLIEEQKPIFHFQQYSKHSIQRPIPVISPTEEEQSRYEELMDDSVVKYYMSLPMAGCKKEKLSEDKQTAKLYV